MGIQEDVFGELTDPGSGITYPIKRYTLSCGNSLEVQVINYGAAITSICMPDKFGQKDDVTLGFDNIDGYIKNSYIGSTIGRYGNRICRGTFQLDGKEHQLTINNNQNHLHGGTKGWDKHVWDSSIEGNSVVFSLLSPEGDQGYSGSVLTQVTYSIRDEGRLFIEYQALTTRATPINMTNHAFFNLAGHATGRQALLQHTVKLAADHFLPVTADVVPTGEVCPVGGTAFDLRSPILMREALGAAPDGGFDHCFLMADKRRGELEFAARMTHPPSGRVLEVLTTEPGLQLYTSNFLPKEDGTMVGRGGVSYCYQGAFCLESENCPDAVNQPNFPNGVLRPGQVYRHTIVYQFSLLK